LPNGASFETAKDRDSNGDFFLLSLPL
jgi:hypothetical protein